MNKKFSFCVCLLSFLAVAMNVSAKRVLPSEAQNRAAEFSLRIQDAKLRYQSTQSGGTTISAKPELTYTAQQGDEVYFYVFNYADGGWVMIGGDDVCQEVMAYSYTGSFKYEKCPKNLKMWLKGYEREISSCIAYVAKEEASGNQVPRTAMRTASKGSKIDALIETHWDQESPYWNMCPKQSGKTCYTGCVATAMAQVIYFHKWPAVGVGSKTYTDSEGCGQTLSTKFYEHTYDYDNMKLETSQYSTTAQKNAVAQLMYDCGVSVEMMYTNEGSGAYSEDIPKALYTYFDYDQSTLQYVEKSKYSSDSWAQMIYDELAAGRPVLYAGADGTGYDAGGHQFVCDGYEYKSSADYFHFNWGWSGEDDGFFTLATVGKTGYQFKYYQDAVIGIAPNNSQFYTVTLDDDSTKLTPATAGGSVTLPVRELKNYNFCGWSPTDILLMTTTKPASLYNGTYTPTKNLKLYPVYSFTKEESGEESTTLISEDFASVKTGDNTTTGGSGTAWSGNTNFPTVSSVTQAGGAIRVGSSKSKGSIMTSALNVQSGKTVNVTFDVKGWSTVEGDVKVELGSLSSTVTYSNTMSDGFETKTVSFVANSASPTLKMSSTNKRLFLDNIIVTVGGAGTITYYFTHHSMPVEPTANVVITDQNDEKSEFILETGDTLSLSDDIKSLKVTKSISDVNLTYTRNFSDAMVGNWQAWYMPCDFDFDDMSADFDVAQIAGVLLDGTGNSYIAFKKMAEGTVLAHTPYVVCAKAAGDVSISAITTLLPTEEANTFSVQSTFNNFTFGGVYENTYLSAEYPTYAMNKAGNFAMMGISVFLRPLRICMRITDREDNPYKVKNTPQEVKIVVLGEDETNITDIDANVDADGEIYNLAGQKLKKLQKGINIVNGKKVLF